MPVPCSQNHTICEMVPGVAKCSKETVLESFGKLKSLCYEKS